MSKPVPWDEVYRRLADAPAGRLYGVPRGGAIVAGLTGRAVDSADEADCLVDDVADSGDTLRVMSDLTGKPTWTLFDRQRDGLSDRDLIFPWDDPARTQEARLLRLGRDLLDTLGYDVASPSLRETPRRWAAWWTEFLNQDAGRTNVTFDVVTEGQLVVVGGIHLWSVCEHHLLPFEVTVSVGRLCPRWTCVGIIQVRAPCAASSAQASNPGTSCRGDLNSDAAASSDGRRRGAWPRTTSLYGSSGSEGSRYHDFVLHLRLV